MTKSHLPLLTGIFLLTAAAPPAPPPKVLADLSFFAGSTESISVTKVMWQKAYVTHTLGRGSINPDGSLQLVQHVKEQGGREFERRWQIHQLAPGHFSGTMSEASGPVSVDKIGHRYCFRFAMKGNLSVEQWLTPRPDMTSADTRSTIRKLGIAVAHSTGWIRRTDLVRLEAKELPLRRSS